MTNQQELFRKIPKIDVLLAEDMVKKQIVILSRTVVVDICRKVVESSKLSALKNGDKPDKDKILSQIIKKCRIARSNVLGRVINGTGVLGHTNMGRSPLGEDIFSEIAKAVGGYSNLEINVLERKRGIRGPHVSSLLAQACNAQDAIVVNNNAAAMYLILNEFALGKEVVISRGELVQIGGGFRIPDILESSGAILKEVGTTNITTVDDFKNTINDNTGILLKVHQSNFKMSGFVESPEVRDIASLKTKNTILLSDLGSGNLVRNIKSSKITEPTPSDMLQDGADLVCFSCDKMLGGVQGGVIAGNADLIAKLKKNPILRILRVDKITYAALQIILTNHLAGNHDKVTLWKMAAYTRDEIKTRINNFIKTNNLDEKVFSAVNSIATFGGGATPEEEIPSAALQIISNQTSDSVARFFQKEEPPVMGTVKNGAFQMDFRTILTSDKSYLVKAITNFIANQNS